MLVPSAHVIVGGGGGGTISGGGGGGGGRTGGHVLHPARRIVAPRANIPCFILFSLGEFVRSQAV